MTDQTPEQPKKSASLLRLEEIKEDTTSIGGKIEDMDRKLDAALNPDPNTPSAMTELPEVVAEMAREIKEMKQIMNEQTAVLNLLRGENSYLLMLLERHLGITSHQEPEPPEPDYPTEH